jgi:hypothetical protein
MMPDFLCVGAAKGGSTTIHDVLSRHPGIFLPHQKEIHFFDNDENFYKGGAWYEAQFTGATPGTRIGEVTPAYMSYENVPRRIEEALGRDVKLIFTLREPVARAYSEFLHNRRRGFFQGEFLEAISWESERAHQSQWEKRKISFLSRGLYGAQISRFLEIFPRDNMFFIVLEEDLGQNAADTFSRLFRFLGVDPIEIGEIPSSNQAYEPRFMGIQKLLFMDNPLKRVVRRALGAGPLRRRIRLRLAGWNARSGTAPRLDRETRRQLQARHFSEDIESLEGILGRDLSVWRVVGEGLPDE